MQTEEAVEIDGAVALAGRGDGEIAAQRAIVAVAVGRHGGEAVHAAAQDGDDEAALSRGLGDDGARQRGGEQACPGGAQKTAAACHNAHQSHSGPIKGCMAILRPSKAQDEEQFWWHEERPSS
jgi:hypothetical protein